MELQRSDMTNIAQLCFHSFSLKIKKLIMFKINIINDKYIDNI